MVKDKSIKYIEKSMVGWVWKTFESDALELTVIPTLEAMKVVDVAAGSAETLALTETAGFILSKKLINVWKVFILNFKKKQNE